MSLIQPKKVQEPSRSQPSTLSYTNSAYDPNASNDKEYDHDDQPPSYDQIIEINENAKKFGQNVQRY